MNRAEPPMRCIPVSEGAVVCKPKGQKTVSEPVQQTHKLIKASKLSCVELVPIRPLIQRIPIEIVQLIAHYCVNAGESPIKLGHVCAYLRTAVIGAKLIWTNIILANQREQSRVTRNNQGFTLVRNCNYLRLLLTRAASVPLSIAIEIPLYNTKLLSMLAKCRYSIKALKFIESGDDSAENPFFEAVHYIQPQLDVLGKVVNPSKQSGVETDIDASVSMIDQIVQHSVFTCVVNASIMIRGESSPGGASRKVELPGLRRLVLKGTLSPTLLSRLQMPNLEYLDIDGGYRAPDLYITHLPSTVHSLIMANVSLCCDQSFPFNSLSKLSITHVSTIRVKPGFLLAPRLTKLDWSTAQLVKPGEYAHPFVCPKSKQFRLFGPNLLQYLTFRSMELDVSITQELGQENHLETVCLQKCRLSKCLLKWLSDCGKERALPNLTRLSLQSCECEDNEYSLTDFASDCALNSRFQVELV